MSSNGKLDSHGEWRPQDTIESPVFYSWPFKFVPAMTWLIKRNFTFWPYLLAAIVVFYVLQPGKEQFETLQFLPILGMYARNVTMMLLVYGCWHLLLYTFKLNGSRNKYDSKWQNVGHQQFLFKNQTYDNMFHSLVTGAGMWTAYEVAYYWCWQHGYLPEILNFIEHPFLFTLQLILIPFWRSFHFYWIHRLLHWKPLYVRFHALHHKNVNIGPWSGMAMHPVEHLGYISCVLVHWVFASHPIHFFYNMILTTLTPVGAHTGFQGEVLDGKRTMSSDN